jgi:DNA repair exonuclease SbcCD ATPase subunit
MVENQNREQGKLIEELRESLRTLNQSNIEQARQIELLRADIGKLRGMEEELGRSREEIAGLKRDVAALKRDKQLQLEQQQKADKLQIDQEQKVDMMQKELVSAQEVASRLREERDRELRSSSESRVRMEQMANKIVMLERKGSMSPQFGDSRIQKKQENEIKELQAIIDLQEKSINNYHSDLNFL